MKAFLACLLSLLLSIVAFGQQTEHYTATVGADQVPVRSAPFHDQYVCSYLNAGDQVQVFRETKSGFLAIRPLYDSYSWVDAEKLDIHADGDHATVKHARVPSWVGSYGDRQVRYGYTVLLNRGEIVTLIGQKKIALSSAQPSHSYYKIAPPAGEFRWIHKRHLVNDFTGKPDSHAELAEAGPRESPKVSLASFTGSDESSQILTTTNAGAYVPRWIRPSGQVGPFTQVKSDRIRDRVRPGQLQPRMEDKIPFRQASFRVQNAATENYSTVAELEFAVSQMATRPSEQWSIGLLLEQAQQILAKSGAADQGAIERVIERLNQYQQVKDEHQRAATIDVSKLPPRSTDLHTRNLPFTESDLDSSEVGSGILSAEARRTAYLETGYLVRVRSSRNDSPEYAIVDAQGAIQVFVTPQPGLNLSSYVRRHVGVFGRRGYLYRLKTQHVTVSRIVDLDRHKK